LSGVKVRVKTEECGEAKGKWEMGKKGWFKKEKQHARCRIRERKVNYG
jgi:hypothetical protein